MNSRAPSGKNRPIVTLAFFPRSSTLEAIPTVAVWGVNSYPGLPELHAAFPHALVGLLSLSWTPHMWAHWSAWANLLPLSRWAYVLLIPRKVLLGWFTIFWHTIGEVRIIDSKGGDLVKTPHLPALTVALPEVAHRGAYPCSLCPSSSMVSKCYPGVLLRRCHQWAWLACLGEERGWLLVFNLLAWVLLWIDP